MPPGDPWEGHSALAAVELMEWAGISAANISAGSNVRTA